MLKSELGILKKSHFFRHSISAVPLMPASDRDLFSTIEHVAWVKYSHSLYGLPCAWSMRISSPKIEILTANLTLRHGEVGFPQEMASFPTWLTNKRFKKTSGKP